MKFAPVAVVLLLSASAYAVPSSFVVSTPQAGKIEPSKLTRYQENYRPLLEMINDALALVSSENQDRLQDKGIESKEEDYLQAQSAITFAAQKVNEKKSFVRCAKGLRATKFACAEDMEGQQPAFYLPTFYRDLKTDRLALKACDVYQNLEEDDATQDAICAKLSFPDLSVSLTRIRIQVVGDTFFVQSPDDATVLDKEEFHMENVIKNIRTRINLDAVRLQFVGK